MHNSDKEMGIPQHPWGLTQASGQYAPALSNKVYPYTVMLLMLTFITSAMHQGTTEL
ncbi:hypothetical protein [Colwellia sp. MT41]|uniref:hypothetical protein n=1 Tax=Colwellia sp. MT41 TaxID=58049 RepID=UPI000A66FFA2|nr:hypothetical protein [Colwellia sp. MT41]